MQEGKPDEKSPKVPINQNLKILSRRDFTGMSDAEPKMEDEKKRDPGDAASANPEMGQRTKWIFRYLNLFERGIYLILIFLLAFVVLFAMVELFYVVFTGIFDDTAFRLETHEFLNLLGYFLLVLIGIELLDTIKAYITKHEIHVEVIILLAVIALSRKLILFDPTTTTEATLIGIAVAIASLGVGYYLIKKVGVTV